MSGKRMRVDTGSGVQTSCSELELDESMAAASAEPVPAADDGLLPCSATASNSPRPRARAGHGYDVGAPAGIPEAAASAAGQQATSAQSGTFEQLPAELLAPILQHLDLSEAWQLRIVCRAWREVVESASWTLERRSSPRPWPANQASARPNGKSTYDAPDLAQLSEMVRAGRLQLQRLGMTLTISCLHQHSSRGRKACPRFHAQLEPLVRRFLDLLEACSASRLALTAVSVVLLYKRVYVCGPGPADHATIFSFIKRTLELLGEGPSAASLRQLIVDAVPVSAGYSWDGCEVDLLSDDSDGTQHQHFVRWPLCPESCRGRLRPSAADVARLLGPFRSLRRLGLAPHAATISPEAAAALAAALPDLRALRLRPTSEASLAALAPLPLALFHLGADGLNGEEDRIFVKIGEGPAIGRLAEGRAGKCLESLDVEWSLVSPLGLKAIARMPKLREIKHVLVFALRYEPRALASLHALPNLAALDLRIETPDGTPDKVSTLLQEAAEVAAAPSLLCLNLEICGPGYEIKSSVVTALLQAARGSLCGFKLRLWFRAVEESEVAAILDVAAGGRLRTVRIGCVVKSNADVRRLKLLQGVKRRSPECRLKLKLVLFNNTFKMSPDIAPADRFPPATRASGTAQRALCRALSAELREALPGAAVAMRLDEDEEDEQSSGDEFEEQES